MGESKSSAAHLDRLVEKFKTDFDDALGGWGQFMNRPRDHRQVGRLGTSAGIIAFGCAKTGYSERLTKASENVITWLDGGGDRGEDHRRNNLVYATMCLALAYAEQVADRRAQEYFIQLERRASVGNALWTPYHSDTGNADEDTSCFVSSYILFTAAMAGWTSQCLVNSATQLQSTYLRDAELHRSYFPLISASLHFHLDGTVSKHVRRETKSLVRNRPSTGDRFNYFFEYLDPYGSLRREYFIIPMDLMFISLAGFKSIPAVTRYAALEEFKVLTNSLDENGMYRAPSTQPSTLEQGFLALAISSVERFESREGRGSWLSRARFELKKPRRGRLIRLVGTVYLIAYTLAIAASAETVYLDNVPVSNAISIFALPVLFAFRHPQSVVNMLIWARE